MKALFKIVSVSAVVLLAGSCGSKGLDNKDNNKEQEKHENFKDSTDQDSTTSSVNLQLNFANSTYTKTYHKY